MGNDGDEGTEGRLKLCRDCASEMPINARKCKACGGFQDARRFLTASQSSITFFLALLALLAHFTSDIRSHIFYFRDFLSGTNFSMNAGLVAIDQEKLTVILSSRRNHAFAVASAICVVYLPADGKEFSLLRIRQFEASQGDVGSMASNEVDWIGQIILSYELEAPEFFKPFDTRMVTFNRVLVGFAGTEIRRLSEEPASFCTFMGADQHNAWAVSALIADARNLADIDALELLQLEVEINRGQIEVGEERRMRLIGELKELRSESK